MGGRSGQGFTLIELLVTIAIMGTAMSFVGPLMIEQVNKSKASAEFKEVAQYVRDSGKVAFLKGQPVEFLFEGKQLTRRVGDQSQRLTFEYLFFPVQTLRYNANGHSDKAQLQVISGKRELTLLLQELTTT